MSRLAAALKSLLGQDNGAAEASLVGQVIGSLPPRCQVTPRRLNGRLVMLDVTFEPASAVLLQDLALLLGAAAPPGHQGVALADEEEGARLVDLHLPGVLVVCAVAKEGVTALRALPLIEPAPGLQRWPGGEASQHNETADLMAAVLAASAPLSMNQQQESPDED